MNLSHSGISLCTESKLDFDKSFEAWVEVGNTEVNELRKFVEELLVEIFVGFLGHVGVLLGAWEFGGVFVGFFDEFSNFGTHRIVIEKLVIAFLDAFVDVGEVGNKARDRFENSGAEEQERSVI